MSRSRTAVAVAVGLLLALVSGCGGSKPSVSITESADQAGVRVFVDSLLTAMQAKKTAHLQVDLGGIDGKGAVRYGATTDLTFSAAFGSKQFTVVLVSGSAYLQQSAGGKFVKIDKDDPVMGSLIGNLSYAGPREALQRLEPGIKRVENKGIATVAGEKLTRFAATIDAKVAAEAFGGDGGVEDTTSAATLDFYVDQDNLVRRVEGTIGGRHVKLLVSDWGAPVTIKAPTADQLLNS